MTPSDVPDTEFDSVEVAEEQDRAMGSIDEMNLSEFSSSNDNQSFRFDVAKHLNTVFNGIDEGEETKLHIAARRGHHDMVRMLLSGRPIKQRKLHIDMSKYPNLSFAHEDFHDKVTAAGKRNSEEMLNCRNRLGATALWLAASAGHAETVKVLCECGANLEIPDIKGQTPLFAAAKRNNVACINELLKAGANPEGSPQNISTPIYIASRENLPDVVRLLIEYGADVNGRYASWNSNTKENVPFVGSVPLYMTIVYRSFECFQLLILNGAELHAASNDKGFGTSLVTGVLRHQCDVRYLKLIAACGGIWQGDKRGIDESIAVFQQSSYGLGSTRQECIEFLKNWSTRPMTLTELCRIRIREKMGQTRLKFLKDLPLPPSILRYVTFQNVLN